MVPKKRVSAAPVGAMNMKVEKALNDQINAELYSAYLYLSMSSWFDSIGLRGFANWERVQAMEERDHALKIFDYVLARGGRAIMQQIDAPQTEWKDAKDAMTRYVKEENARTILDQLNMISQEKGVGLLYMLDKELGTRVYTPPVTSSS